MLTFLAPIREWVRASDGTYSSRPWTSPAIQKTVMSGGRFKSGQHDFASRAVAELATALMSIQKELLSERKEG